MAFSVSITPSNPTVKVTEEVHFVAHVTGEPVGGLTYQWYLDGEPVEGETNSIFDYTTTAIGEYVVKCEVTDEDDPPVTEEGETTLIVLTDLNGTIQELLEEIEEHLEASKAYLLHISKAV